MQWGSVKEKICSKDDDETKKGQENKSFRVLYLWERENKSMNISKEAKTDRSSIVHQD